jgi:acetolactate synthase-1/2/3 large subunit
MTHGGDLLVEMLLRHEVSVVFGIAGGQTLPLYDGIRSRAPRIRHIPFRDERNAGYAADAYARLSRKVGICDATVGPGAIKFVSALGEAFNASVPIIAIVSDMPSDWLAVRYRGGGNQLVDQKAILAPVSKWTCRLPHTDLIPEMVRRAFQMATSGRPGPVVIEFPEDLFKQESKATLLDVDLRFGTVPPHRPAPDADSVTEALALLGTASQPVMIAGGGANLSQAGEAIQKLAEHLAMPVATTHSGMGILQETHPLALGVLGALGGSTAAKKYVEGADVILAIGYKFGQNPTYRWQLPKPDQRIIQIDIDGSEIGKLFPVEVGMVADAQAGLLALLRADPPARQIEPVVENVAKLKAEWKREIESQAVEAEPIKPQYVMSVVNDLAGPEDILVCDASFASGWGSMYFEIRENRRALFPRGLAGLGWGLPAAIGAQVAKPEANIIVLSGDGAMTFSLGELATLAQEGMNVKVVVLNNSTMGWIKWDQAVSWDGKFISTDLGNVDFSLVAKGLGCEASRVTESKEVRDAIAQALAHEGPVLLDVHTSVGDTPVSKFIESKEGKDRILSDSPE